METDEAARRAGEGRVFGEQVRAHRQRLGLSQEDLARRAGVDVKTVRTVERGQTAPRPSTIRKLADALRLDDPARGEFFAAAAGGGTGGVGGGAAPGAGAGFDEGTGRDGASGIRPPDPRIGIPSDPTAYFVGRETELLQVRAELVASGRLAVHGLPGVGKTQLVARYLRDYRDEYPDGVFWIRAEQESSLVGDLAGLAWRLELDEQAAPEQERQIDAVLRWLRRHPQWLLVLDNLEPAVIPAQRRWLPPGLPGHLLVTSRAPLPSPHIRLDPLPSEVASQYLVHRTGQDDWAAAAVVADTLGRLPLALAQAAAYIDETGRDLASYATLLDTHLVALMAEGQPDDYPRSVFNTLNLSLQRLERERPVAALLRLCAFLAGDDIPIGVLQRAAGALPPELAAALRDDIETDRTIAALRRYSLVDRQADSLRVHRIVQAIVRHTLPAGEYLTWLTAAVRVLTSQFPDNPEDVPQLWPSCARLLPHAYAVECLTGGQAVDPVALTALLDRVGTYLWCRGEYRLAEPLLERGASVCLGELGEEHAHTARSLQSLALLRWYQGDLAGGRALLERSLALLDGRPETDDRILAEVLHNLATIVQAQGDLEAARPLYERALTVRRRALGPGHPHTAYTLNNLGTLLRNQGHLAAARPLLEQALQIRQDALGPDHPHTTHSLHHLGWLLRDQGDLTAAQPLLERALAVREQVLGPDHEATARTRYHLAILLWRKGETTGAERLARVAAASLAERLGADHRWTREAHRAVAEIHPGPRGGVVTGSRPG